MTVRDAGTGCSPGCVVCAGLMVGRVIPTAAVASVLEHKPARVEHLLVGVQVASARAAFPSLELMAKPITPALPRITPFMRADADRHYRCRVELRDIARKRHAAGLTLSDYAAPAAEGWGNTPDRAYQAWKSKWRALFEPKQQ